MEGTLEHHRYSHAPSDFYATIMKRLATVFALALFLIALPFESVLSQSTSGSLTGTVVDENGDPLPGVNIVAVHQPTGTEFGVATNANGRYAIRNVRVGGPYTVTASFVGYRTVRETGITVQLDQERRIDFQLEPATEELDELEVVGEQQQVISSDRTGAARNVSTEEIDALPTIDRSLTDFSRLIPQSSGSGSNSLAGANGRYNSIQIDGATLDDVFGLGEAVPGSQAGAQPISLDAIEEFNIEIAPYDIRSSGFTGGQINAVTKSGSNEFEGSVRYLGRNETLVREDLDGRTFSDFSENFFVGTLGGPIIEDELFFFVTAELRRRTDPLESTDVFSLPDETLDRYGFGSTTDVLERQQEISQNQYGWDPGGFEAFSEGTNNEKILAKLDWNINSSHRLTLRHNYVDAIEESGVSRSTNSLDFSSSRYNFNSSQNSMSLKLNSTFGNNAFNEFNFVYTRIRDSRDPQFDLRPEVATQFADGDFSISQGIGRFNQANRLDQDIFEITNDFTYVVGDHTLTFGTSNEIFSVSNLFIQDFVGSYEFSPFEVTDENGNVVREVSPVEAFELGVPSDYRFSASRLDNPVPEAEFTSFKLGAYAQTEWDILSSLKITAGLRLDAPVIPDEPLNNPDAEDAFGRSTSNIASGNLLFSPRFGFNYSQELIEDFSTQIRGGTGLFAGRPPFVWISNQFSNTGVDFTRIRGEFDPGEAFFDNEGNQTGTCFSPTGDPSAQPRPGDCNGQLGTVEQTEVNFIDEDFDFPQTWRTNLAVDQELPYNLTMTLEGIWSSTINNVVFRNLNLEQSQTSPNGRPLYGDPLDFGDGVPVFVSFRNTVDDRFTDAILLENTDRGYQGSATVQLQRQVREGINGSVAYTYTRAKNVNNGTSSRAISNWQFNENVDVNDPGLGTADFERRHRFIGNLNYRFEWGDRFATSIGAIYEGQSGSPFSWITAGDANGDGQAFNDLVYVPESEDEVVVLSNNWEELNSFIEEEDALSEHRGGFTERNAGRDPFQHILDLRVNQEIATVSGQSLEFTAVLENALNLLNSDWGRIQFSQFNNNTAWVFSDRVSEDEVGSQVAGQTITSEDVGKPKISFDEGTAEDLQNEDLFDTANTSSRWRLQLGIRYTF
jgi:hypothetical protein